MKNLPPTEASGCVSKDTKASARGWGEHFLTSAAIPEKVSVFWGDICTNVLLERVGARAFPVCCAGAHAKTMPLQDAVTSSSLALSQSFGDSRRAHSCFSPHSTQGFCQGGLLSSRKSNISADNRHKSFSRDTQVESCLVSARAYGLTLVTTVLSPASGVPARPLGMCVTTYSSHLVTLTSALLLDF